MARKKDKKCKDLQHPSCTTHRPVQVQAPIIPPVHREALVTPQHTIIIPRASQTSLVMDNEPTLHVSSWGHQTGRRLSQISHIQEDDETNFHEWLSPWCTEPPGGDLETCCMGTWIPCVLHGKTHWRLNQVSRGEDATNARWTGGMGWNSYCGGWFCACLASFCLGPGAMTAAQRTRIRGTYGIKGSVLQDACRGIWCCCCTQIQNDREVQAREGNQKLRYNKTYHPNEQGGPINIQPHPPAPMSYTPARQGFEQMVQVTKLTPNAKKLQQAQPGTGEELEVVQVEIDVPKPVSSRLDAKQQQEKKQESSDRTHKPKKDKIAVKRAQQNSQEMYKDHDGQGESHRLSSELTVTDKKASQDPGKNSNSPLNSMKDNVSAAEVKSNHDLLSAAHPLDDCVGTETDPEGIEGKNQPQPKDHALDDCTAVETDTRRGATASSESHRLSDCGIASSEDIPGQELSYYHDFTDCPVDKAVLDYYEDQERKLQQHSLSDDARESSSTSPRGEVHQHSLTDDTPINFSTSPRRKVQQHSLSEDGRANLSTTSKVQQHSLADDVRPLLFTTQSQKPSNQHTECQCIDLNRAGISEAAARQDRSACCTTDVTIVQISNRPKAHRLTTCPPEYLVEPTRNDRPKGDESHTGSEPSKDRSLASSNPKNDADGSHVHDESCLAGSYHHKCALNFEITTTSAKNYGDENHFLKQANDAIKRNNIPRRKPRRFKSPRKSNDTKTASGSNDNKSGRSGEKSAQSAHSQASSTHCDKNVNT